MTSLDKEDISTMMEGTKVGNYNAAVLAMEAGDARAMGQSLKHLLTKESVEAFVDND